MPELTTIIALLMGIILGLGLIWYRAQSLSKVAGFQIIDSFIISLICFFVVNRLLGLIYFSSELVGVGASFLPVVQPDEVIIPLATWPWLFFRFYDGLFFFVELASALVIAQIFIRLIHGRRLKSKRVEIIATSAVAVALIPFGASMYYNSYLGTSFNPPVAAYFLVTTILIAVATGLFATKRIALYAVLFVAQVAGLLYMNLAAAETSNLGIIYVLQVLFIIVNLVLMLNELTTTSLNSAAQKNEGARRSARIG